MTTIILNDKAKIEFYQECWQPVLFKAGGATVRNPSNGEMIVTKDKWDKHDVYYQSPQAAIKYIAAQLCLEKEEYVSLREYLATYEAHIKDMLKAVP